MKRAGLPTMCLVLLLSACGAPQLDVDAIGTQIAADIFATQTAAVSTPTPVSIRLEGDGSGDHRTLEKAVQSAPERATIVSGAGTYRLAEPLDISKPLSLKGAGMDETEIVSEAQGYVIRFSGDGPFVAEDITFRHEGEAVADVVVVGDGEMAFVRCRFTGAVSAEGQGARSGLRLRGSTAGVVRDCVAVQNKNFGILSESQAQPTLQENLCTGNGVGITYLDSAGGMARQNECASNAFGVLVSDQSRPTVEGNVCTDNEEVGIAYSDEAGGVARQNECSRNGGAGILVSDRSDPTLEKNVCADNEESGIVYGGYGGGVARQNECSGNQLNGIEVLDHAQPRLEGNVCADNGGAGIAYRDSAGGVARGNQCSRNGLHGIGMEGQPRPTLEDNVCTDNEEVGIAYLDEAGGVARRNVCSQNGRHGIGLQNQAQPTLEGNVCMDNDGAGIAYIDNAGGVARHNECSGNLVGIFVVDIANPELVDNNCHDNTEADIWDERS